MSNAPEASSPPEATAPPTARAGDSVAPLPPWGWLLAMGVGRSFARLPSCASIISMSLRGKISRNMRAQPL